MQCYMYRINPGGKLRCLKRPLLNTITGQPWTIEAPRSDFIEEDKDHLSALKIFYYYGYGGIDREQGFSLASDDFLITLTSKSMVIRSTPHDIQIMSEQSQSEMSIILDVFHTANTNISAFDHASMSLNNRIGNTWLIGASGHDGWSTIDTQRVDCTMDNFYNTAEDPHGQSNHYHSRSGSPEIVIHQSKTLYNGV